MESRYLGTKCLTPYDSLVSIQASRKVAAASPGHKVVDVWVKINAMSASKGP
jgi:hypothetical protein